MAQKYVENILASVLEEYVDRFDESSLEIGIWEGDVALTNLTFKQMEWNLSPGINLALEYGHVEKVQVQIPWMELRSGNVSAIVDTCHVMLRVKIVDAAAFSDRTGIRADPTEYSADMAKVLAEELKLLSASPDTWMSRAMDSFGSNVLKQVAGGSSLSIDHLKCSILLPTSAKDYLHVQAQFEALDIDPLKDPPKRGKLYPKPELVLAKDVSVRGLKVHVASELVPLPASLLEYEALFDQFEPADIFLNPIHMLAHLWVHKMGAAAGADEYDEVVADGALDEDNSFESEEAFTLPWDDLTISFETHLSNLEITPNLRQLVILRDFSTYLFFINLRASVAHLHPSARAIQGESAYAADEAYFQLPGSHLLGSSFSAHEDSHRGKGVVRGYPVKQWWKYAVKAIIIMNRKRKADNDSKKKFERKDAGVCAPRNKMWFVEHELPMMYMRLYQKFMTHKLSLLESSHAIIGEGSKKAFTTLDLIFMEKLQKMCNVADIIRYRTCVHKNLQFNGEYQADLLLAVKDTDTAFIFQFDMNSWKELYPIRGRPKKQRLTLDSVGDLSYIKKLDENLKEIWMESSEKAASKIQLNVNVSLTRFAVVILQTQQSVLSPHESKEAHPIAASLNPDTDVDHCDRAFTLALYGINVSLAKSDVRSTLDLGIDIGAVRSYGYGNVEILSCGNEANDWLQHFNSDDEEKCFKDYAIRFFFCSAEKDIVKNDVIVAHANTSMKQAEMNQNAPVRRTDIKHIKITLDVMLVTLSWDHLSMEFLKEMGLAIKPHSHFIRPITESESRKEFILRNENNDLTDDEIFARRASLSSLDVVLRGLSLSISNANIIRASETVSNKYSGNKKKSGVAGKKVQGSTFNHLAISEESLVVKIGTFSIISGDFLEAWVDSGDAATASSANLEDINFISFMAAPWNQADNSLRMLTRTFRHPLLVPMVFHLNDFEVFRSIEKESKESNKIIKAKILCKPWCLAGIISSCVVPLHRELTDTRIDVNISPLNVSISQDDSIAVIDAVNGILDIFDSEVDLNGNDDMLYPYIEPRVSLLANKCKLHVNLALSSANIALTKDDEGRHPRQSFEQLFQNFGKLVLHRGAQTQLIIAHRKIFMCQLQEALPLADGLSNAKNIIDTFLESIKSENHMNRGIQEVIHDAVKDAVDDLFEVCAGTPAGKASQCILDLRLTGLQLTTHKYTYETSCTFQFTNFSCLGGQGKLPLLRVHDDSYQFQQLQRAEDDAKAAAAAAAEELAGSSKKNDYSSKSRKKPPRSGEKSEKSGKHRVTIEQSLEAFEDHLARSALTVSYTEHENGYNIAWGGVSPKEYFRHKNTIVERKFLHIPPTKRKRVGKLEITALEVSVLLHSEVIPATCAVIVQSAEVVGKHMNLLRKRKQNLRYILNKELKSVNKANTSKNTSRGDTNIDYFSEAVRGGLTYNADLSNFRRSQYKNQTNKQHEMITQQFIDCPDAYIPVLKSISTSDAHLIVQHTGCRVKFYCLRARNHIELSGNRMQIEKAKGLLSQVLVRGYLAKDRGATSIRCNIRFDSVDLILGYENDIFALAQVQRGEFSLNYNPITAHVRVTGSLHDLNLHDFSELGALHPLVLWRSETLLEEDAMISFTLAVDLEQNKDDPQKQVLSVELLGMRVSLLSRFFQELIIYLKEKFVGPLTAALTVFSEKEDEPVNASTKGISDPHYHVNSSSSSSEDNASSSDTDSDEYEQYMVTPTNPTRKIVTRTTPLNRAFIAPAAGANRFQKQSATPSFPSDIDSNSESLQKEEEEVDESWLHWDIRLVDCDIIIPRNSSSNDLIALQVAYAVVNNDKVVDVIKAPTPEEVFNTGLPIAREKHLHFDPDLNRWTFTVNERKEDDSFELPLVSDASVDSGSSRSGSPAHFQSFSPFSAMGGSPVPVYSPPVSTWERKSSSPIPEHGLRSISPHSRVSKYVSLVEQMNPISPSTAEKSRGESNDSDSEKNFASTRRDSIDGFEFFDACDADESKLNESNASFQEKDSPKIRVIPPLQKEKDNKPSNIPKKKEKQIPYTTNRLCVDLHQVSIYASLSGPYKNSTVGDGKYINTEETRKYLEIKHDQPVYLVNYVGSSMKANESVQRWRMVTQDLEGDIPFNMFVVVDCQHDGLPNEVGKVMIGDNDSLTPLSLQVTMSEFTLLQALWFDNMFESPQCFTPNIPFSIPPEAMNLPLYGTAAYFKHLTDTFTDFEFIIVRSEILLDCYMDADYFGQEMPATKFLRLEQLLELLSSQPAYMSECIFHGKNPLFPNAEQGLSGSMGDVPAQWSNCSFPLAKLYIEGFVMHNETKMKDRVEDVGMLCAVAAGVVEIFDTRIPRDLSDDVPRVLRVAPLDPGNEDAPGGMPKDLTTERVYGWAETTYGINLSSYDICKPQDSPFKLLVAKTKHYTNLNIGIDGTELNLRNLDFIFLLVDFFAMFYQHPGFGHPLKDLVNAAGADKLPYDCVDTRVFASRPHISIMEDIRKSTSSTLVIETDRGLYFRQLVDSDNSSKVELKLVDAVAVIHKLYCGPELSRGRRGSAGSGRGIRTQLESLCVEFSAHYDATLNHNDVQVKIEPTVTVDNADFFKSSDRWKRIFRSGKEFPRSENTSSRRGPGFRTSGLQANQSHQASGLNSFINYNSDYLFIAPAEISPPKTVYPLDDNKDSKEFATCNIVTSYEDILFSVSMITDFLNTGPAATLSQHPVSAAGVPLPGLAGDGERKRKGGRKTSATTTTAPVPKESPSAGFTATKANGILSAADRERERDAFLIDKKKSSSYYGVVSLSGVKIILVDNVLGLHLPLVSVVVKDIRMNACHMRKEKKLKMRRQTTIMGADGKEKRVFRTAGGFYSRDKWEEDYSNEKYVDKNGAPLFYTKVYGTMHMWADYFNNLKKCWEPLLEQVKASVIFDRGSNRGDGYIVRMESPIQVNISGAFFRTLNDLIRMFQSVATLPKREGKTAVSTWSDPNGRPVSERIASGLNSTEKINPHSSMKASEEFATVLNENADPQAHSHAQFRSQHMGGYRQSGIPRRSSRSSAMSIYNYRQSFIHNGSSPIRGVFGERLVRQEHNEMQSEGIRHMKYTPLEKSSRFGFSIKNSSGQQIRFLQQNESGKDMICYIDDGERGALNFVASTTRIRNNAIIREGFNVQMEYAGMERKNAVSATTRKTLAIQISGHSWLPQVQADELGVKFEDLQSLNSVNHELIHDWKIQNALKLVVEVTPLDGGRVLHLRSVFTIKNNTSHDINIYALEHEEEYGNQKNSEFIKDDPFVLNISENFHVPLALMQRTAAMSHGKNLGFLKIKPADLAAVEKELGPRSDIQYGVNVSYTNKSVDLMETITNTETWFSMLDKRHTDINELQKISMVQMGCTISPRLRRKKSVEEMNEGPHIGKSSIIAASKLPPFCYNVEIQRIGDTNLINMQNTKVKQSLMQGLAGRLFRSKNHDKETKYRLPVHYNFVIHPPIILENLLPMSGTFEILHADQQRVLWSAVIKPGKAVPIHTVTLEEPLRLRINLSYCRTVDPQVRIHTPISKSKDQRTFVDKLQRTVEEFLEDSQDEDSSVELTDTVGQRLRLGIENIEGGGGQRHVTVYCPYWIVNLSQYSVRIREEGAPRDQLPAGTVTPNKDGTASVAYGVQDVEASTLATESESLGSASPGTPVDRPVPRGNGGGTIFPGKTPLFHSSRQAEKVGIQGSMGKQISKTSALKSMLYDLHFDEIVDMAYMYNYPDNRITGKRRVLIQMDDSDWSEPISLDSVGTPFSVQVEHAERGHLELGYKIKMAPGRLGKYTKIVRMMPRFILDNRIGVPLNFTQPAGFMGETEQWRERAMVIKPMHYCPFHLSDMYTQRSLSIQYEGPYSRTVFFRVEDIGTHTMKANYALDLATVPHVNTRDAPEYTVIFPADKDIGLFLETDWGENNIVVREFRAGGFAYTETDMQLRDVIIKIDDEVVSGKNFDHALSLLTNRTKAVEVRVRTNEENIRRLRLAAVARVPEKNKEAKTGGVDESEKHAKTDSKLLDKVLRLGIQQYEASIFISVEEIEPDVKPEYKFMNTTTSHWIHYKQKGVLGNNWCSLAPGETIAYTWENPFLPHKLSIKAGRNVLSPRLNAQEESDFIGIGSNVLVNGLDCLTGVAIDDHAIMSISLDEIGKKHFQISLPDGSAGRLVANVAVAGSTKTLSIGPDSDMHLRELLYSTMFLDKQRLRLTAFRNMLNEFYTTSFSGKYDLKKEDDESLADHQQHFIDERLLPQIREDREVVLEIVDHMDNGIDVDRVLVSDSPVECVLGQHINKLNQIEIEVLEAKELRPFVIGKMEDVYVSVEIQHELLRSEMAKELIKGSLGLGRGQKQCTYMCEKNMNPSFIGQKFLFDVPAEAFDKKREFKVCVRVMCDSVVRAMDKVLGQADIQFTSLVKEEELFGWFPLRSSKKNITNVDGGMDIAGSIKLRVQWVHSSKGLSKSTLNRVNHRLSEVESQAKIQNEALMKLHDSHRDKNSDILSMLPQARENDRLQAFSLMEADDGTLFKDTDESLLKRLSKPKAKGRSQSVANAAHLTSLSDEWDFQDHGKHASSDAAKHFSLIDDSFSPSILDAAFESKNREDAPRDRIVRSNSAANFKSFMDIDQLTPTGTPRRVPSTEGNLSTIRSLFAEALPEIHAGKLNNSKQKVAQGQGRKIGAHVPQSISNSYAHKKVEVRHKWSTILKTIIESKQSQYLLQHSDSKKVEMHSIEGTSAEHNHPLMASGGGSAHPQSLLKRQGALTIQHPDQIYVHQTDNEGPSNLSNFNEVIGRKSTFINCANNFVRVFDDECDRSHQHVHTQGGRLEVTPIKALHLPGSMKKSMFVRIIYGAEKKHTVSVKHAADLSWYHDNVSSDTYGEDAKPENSSGISANGNYTTYDEKAGVYNDENSSTKCFDIETLNIRSQLTIEVVDDSLFKKKVIAKLSIPILNLLDNLCGPEGEAEVAAMRESAAAAGVTGCDPQVDSIYNAWFPLTLSENAISSDGDVRSWSVLSAEQLDYTKLPQSTPCIKLRFGWKKTTVDSLAVLSNINMSKEYARVQIPYLSIAVVDSVKAREVLQWSIFSTELRGFTTTKHTDFMTNVMWTQIDNQLPEQISPVLLAPTPTKCPQPTVRYHVRKNNELSKDNLTSYDTVQAIIQTMDMRLEQQTVVATWALIKSWLQESQESISSSHSNKGSGKDKKEKEKETPIDQLGFATCFDNVVYDLLPTLGKPSKAQKMKTSGDNYNGDGQEAEKMIYISYMNIGPIKINASFIMNPSLTGGGLSTQKRQTRTSMSDDVDLKSSVMLFFSMVGDVALDITSSIADAPISFPVYKRNTIFETENEVNKRMRQHYLYAALTQLYKIVGSLELVGNPIGLVSSLGTGVKDFFYEPSNAMITSPTEVGKITRGVLKGTISLVGNTAEGLIGTSTTITRSFGRGVSKLSMDQTFIVAREALHRPARTLTEASMRPFKDIINGIYCGVVGIVKVPYSSFRRNSTVFGVGSAVVKGVAGLVAKPAVGVLDAVTHTGEALRETVRVITREQIIPVHRVRFSNQFGPDGRMLPYVFSTALGTHILENLDRAASEGVGNVINEGRDFFTAVLAAFGKRTNKKSAIVNVPAGQLKAKTTPLAKRRASAYSGMMSPFFDKKGKEKQGTQTGIDDVLEDFIQDDANRGTDRVEFVIHAAIILKADENLSQLVIITTERVLVVDYIKRKRSLSTFVQRWQESIHNLKAPLLERSSVGSITVVLGPKYDEMDADPTSPGGAAGDDDDRAARKIMAAAAQKKRKDDFIIESNYQEEEVIIELYNCLMIVWSQGKLDIDQLETTAIKDGEQYYGEVVTLDEFGVYHIGPWEFKYDDERSAHPSRNSQVYLIKDKHLDMAKWYQDELNHGGFFDAAGGGDHKEGRSSKVAAKVKFPMWLQEERRKAISNHTGGQESTLALTTAAAILGESVRESVSSGKQFIDEPAIAPLELNRGSLMSRDSAFQSSKLPTDACLSARERAESASSSRSHVSALFGVIGENEAIPEAPESTKVNTASSAGRMKVTHTASRASSSKPITPTVTTFLNIGGGSGSPNSLDIPDNESVTSRATNMTSAQADALMNRLDTLEKLLLRLGIDKKLIDATEDTNSSVAGTTSVLPPVPAFLGADLESGPDKNRGRETPSEILEESGN